VARPDFSDYVVHFTTARAPHSAGRTDAPAVVAQIVPLNPLQRLLSILGQQVIIATPMPYTGRPGVCFTECVWGSLLDHAELYSRYGVGFKKSFLFANDGGPVIYMRQDIFRAQVDTSGFDDALWPFITPFVPEYASQEHRAEFWDSRPTVDYTREREWRVPHNLAFGLGDVEFVIVASENDSQEVVNATGGLLAGKVLLMDNYSRVTSVWPLGD
jgi:hypothetical protein